MTLCLSVFLFGCTWFAGMSAFTHDRLQEMYILTICIYIYVYVHVLIYEGCGVAFIASAKYPNMKYISQTMIMIPNAETADTR